MTMFTHFDVPLIRKHMKISHNVEVPIISIARFEISFNMKVIVYEYSICNGNLVELYDNTSVSPYLVILVLHNSHYYLYNGLLLN